MEKFSIDKHAYILGRLPFSYETTPINAECFGYVLERNGEELLVMQSTVFPNEFPCYLPPHKKENWDHCSIVFAPQEFVNSLEAESIKIIHKEGTGTEYFYDTAHFVEPTGEMRRDVRHFSNHHDFTVTHTPSPEKIRFFHEQWKAQKERDNMCLPAGERFFSFCLENLDRFNVQQVYVTVNGELVGLALGVLHSPGKWAGLHLESLYEYKGLGRFLHHERAKLFKDAPEFTLGTEAAVEGIAHFKESLGPSKKVEYSYVLTGERK